MIDTDHQDRLEAHWLDYAWRVVTCPTDHRSECVAAGGAVPGPGRMDGNELRWPGYLGRRYEAGRGVLCVGAVHREGDPAKHGLDTVPGRTDAELVAATRRWMQKGRGLKADAEYLNALRNSYEEALPSWTRYQRHFRSLIEEHLRMDSTQIAWTNLAKCRVSIDRGSAQRAAEQRLTRLCQTTFPVSQLVAAIRPAAVLVAVLRAGENGDIVADWAAPEWRPLVFAWQGQSGHDRHNTDSHGTAFSGVGARSGSRDPTGTGATVTRHLGRGFAARLTPHESAWRSSTS